MAIKTLYSVSTKDPLPNPTGIFTHLIQTCSFETIDEALNWIKILAETKPSIIVTLDKYTDEETEN
jgi:hypothetical protein